MISPIYEVYANKRTGYMDFEVFIKFCSDFQIFPDVINKSDAYRIFMNLAFAHDSFLHSEPTNFNNTKKLYDSRSSIGISSKRASLASS